MILAGRRINDGMGKYVAEQVIKLMIRKGHKVLNAKVLQLGITFKENCPDIRNSHAVDVVREKTEIADGYDAVVLVVAHREFANFDAAGVCREGAVIFDVKGLWPQKNVTARL